MDAVSLFKAGTCKFKSSINTTHGRIQFHIRVYQDSGEHVVEVQRRSGCSVGFNMVFRILCRKLAHLRAGDSPTLDEAQCAVSCVHHQAQTAGAVRLIEQHLLTLINARA
jgi:hypothetical protein